MSEDRFFRLSNNEAEVWVRVDAFWHLKSGI
jgi:hypothetical protein